MPELFREQAERSGKIIACSKRQHSQLNGIKVRRNPVQNLTDRAITSGDDDSLEPFINCFSRNLPGSRLPGCRSQFAASITGQMQQEVLNTVRRAGAGIEDQANTHCLESEDLSKRNRDAGESTDCARLMRIPMQHVVRSIQIHGRIVLGDLHVKVQILSQGFCQIE